MKQLLSMIGGVVVIVSLVVIGFTFRQVSEQQTQLEDDIQRRTVLLADTLKESIRSSYVNKSIDTLKVVLDKFAGRERLIGLAVYDIQGNLFTSSAGLSEDVMAVGEIPQQAMDADRETSDFFENNSNTVFILGSPIHQEEKVIGALVIFQRADYISAAIWETWRTNAIRLLIQALLFSIAVILILKWIIYHPIQKITELIRQVRSGKNTFDADDFESHGIFRPIASEISKISKSLFLARTSASQEARLRLEKLDSPWTAERLKEFIKAYLKDRQIVVVSNREPYIHQKIKNEIQTMIPASGMVTALEPIMEACGGTWLAYGSGDADRLVVNNRDQVKVPPDDPKYTLKRIWLTEEEVKGYYIGFCNEALWPLCHLAHIRPIFRKEDWMEYRKVNGKFAEILLGEIKSIQRPVILIQDFHFSLLPQMIKNSRPDAQIGLFWHIPWPNDEAFSICPWRKQILAGMLGADVIGFHTQQYSNNFLDTISKEIESLVDLERYAVTHKHHTAYIKSFPVSVAFTDSEHSDTESNILKKLNLKTKYLGIGVDRMDYTKGILEKLRGIEFFFELYPSHKGQFTYVQIAPPSREGVAQYRQFSQDVTDEVNRINDKLQHKNWKPIVLLKEHHTHAEIYPIYRAANICLVTSLSDGMNLVAKEFVSSRDDESGVLILSQFTGAARSLKGAIMINPYNAEKTAEAIFKALTMSPPEQHIRMKKMRNSIKNYNVYRWAAEFIKSVADLG